MIKSVRTDNLNGVYLGLIKIPDVFSVLALRPHVNRVRRFRHQKRDGFSKMVPIMYIHENAGYSLTWRRTRKEVLEKVMMSVIIDNIFYFFYWLLSLSFYFWPLNNLCFASLCDSRISSILLAMSKFCKRCYRFSIVLAFSCGPHVDGQRWFKYATCGRVFFLFCFFFLWRNRRKFRTDSWTVQRQVISTVVFVFKSAVRENKLTSAVKWCVIYI